MDSRNGACQIPGGHFHTQKKEAPAASWLAATGLVKSWVVVFTDKKTPAASWLAATGVEVRMTAASWISITVS